MKSSLFCLLAIFFTGCFDQYKATQSKVRIIFPKDKMVLKNRSQDATASVTCYAVLVSFQKNDSVCVDVNDTILSSPNIVAGFFSADESATLLVPTGTDRKIEIIATSSISSDCPDLVSLSLSERAQLGDLLLAGETTVDLLKEEESVEIELSISNALTINKCSGGVFNWEESTSSNNWDQGIWDQATFSE